MSAPGSPKRRGVQPGGRGTASDGSVGQVLIVSRGYLLGAHSKAEGADMDSPELRCASACPGTTLPHPVKAATTTINKALASVHVFGERIGTHPNPRPIRVG